MTICKYFLQGNCRFGDNCKFEHQVSDHSYANSTSILVQQNYGTKPAQPTTSNVDTTTLIKSVINDMTSAEKGGQWLLSSYAPFKEKPAFPGFEDHSMEEIRYVFYESVKNGTVEQYKQNLQMMLQQAVMKIQALQNPSPEAINMLKTIYNTPASSSVTNNNQTFTPTTTNSVFGGSQPQKSVFGGAASNQNVFGDSSNIFNNAQQQSGFGGIPNNAQQQSGFGGITSNAIFGGNATSANLFAGQQSPNATKSIFGGPQAANTNSVFGGNSSVFGNQPQTSVFQSFAQPQQQNLFQQSPTGNQFGALQAPSNQFHAQAPSNQFGAVPTPSSQFGGTVGNKPAFQHTASIFGNMGMQQSGVFAVQSKPSEEFYSKIEQLSEEEIKWFQSDDLDVSKIPERPPTYEMCFKL